MKHKIANVSVKQICGSFAECFYLLGYPNSMTPPENSAFTAI